MEPKVTFIIPTYKRAHMVAVRALRSVLGQTFKDWECIVVDDCSPDNTEEVIKQCTDPRVRYIRLEKNGGVGNARNVGVKESKGKYICMVDDDNEVFSTFLEETVPVLDSAPPDVGAISVGRIIERQSAGYQDYAAASEGGKFDSIDWGWLIRREVFDQISYDNTTMPDDDADFGIQFHKRFKVIPINRPLEVAYDDIDQTKSACYPTPKRLEGLQAFHDKNIDYYKQFPNELRFLYRLMGRNFYWGGHRLKGIYYFWKSFLAMPNFRTFKHLFFILFGWYVYDWYMTIEEQKAASKRI